MITLSSPDNESTEVSRTPTLTWQGDSTAESYRLQVLEGEEPIAIDTVVQSTTFRTSITLEPTTTYTWKVRGLESDTVGRWSKVWSFTTKTKTFIELEEPAPETFALQPNYPNPFNPSTQIRYSLPKVTTVRLTVYNSTGRSVNTLVKKTIGGNLPHYL